VVVVDSSVWIDFFSGRDSPERGVLRTLLSQAEARIVLPDLVLFEVLRGFRSERDLRQARQLFAGLSVEPTVGEALAQEAADQYRRLRSLGFSVRSPVDALIASFCIDRGHVLLHRDRDFLPYAEHCGLRVWQALH